MRHFVFLALWFDDIRDFFVLKSLWIVEKAVIVAVETLLFFGGISKRFGGLLKKTNKSTGEAREELLTFKEKTRQMLPNCFGGFDPNDEICRKYCSRAFEVDAEAITQEIKRRLLGGGDNTFFLRDFQRGQSCRQKKERLIEEIEKMQAGLRAYDKQRQERDRYLFGKSSLSGPEIPGQKNSKKGVVENIYHRNL